jgi:hypothetical protein
MGPRRDRDRPAAIDDYRHSTVRPLYCLVFILPMLVAFQIGAVYYYGEDLLVTHHLRGVLGYFGATGAFVPAILVAATLLAQHIFRKDPWALRGKVFAGMFAESVLWMCPLGVMMAMTGRLQAGSGPEGIANGLLQAFGAGVYEEFLFRLFLVSVALLLFADVMGLPRTPVALGAIVLGGLAFSLYHLSAEQLRLFPDLPWPQVLFRALAGIYLGVVYLYRGFGIAVGAHAFYNLYVLAAGPTVPG